MIQAVKHNEQARQEYRIMSAFEMDAREDGIQQGIQQGIRQGVQQGFADGSYKKALETAKLMRTHKYPIAEICTMTGLSKEEVENI